MLMVGIHTATAPPRMPLAAGAERFTKHVDVCHGSLGTTRGSRSPPLAPPVSR